MFLAIAVCGESLKCSIPEVFAEIAIRSLFVRFVQAMGPSDILSTVAMLLINKSTSKILHADPGHVPDVLNLPLSILEHFAPTLQLAVRFYTLGLRACILLTCTAQASGELLREALAELALEDAAGPQAASGSPA